MNGVVSVRARCAACVVAALLATACGEREPGSELTTEGAALEGAPVATKGAEGTGTVAIIQHPPAPTRSILAPRLAEATPPPDVSPYAADGDAASAEAREMLEFVRALTQTVAEDPSALETLRRDIAAEGRGTVRALVTVALDAETSADARVAAVDLLPASGDGAATHALVYVAEHAAEPWLRQRAAWRARETARLDGADGALIALLLRLKYEKDDEARVWLAGSLAAFDVYAGVADLVQLSASTSPAAGAAASELQRILDEVGGEGAPAGTGAQLVAAWSSGAAPARVDGPSDALAAALWRSVWELSGEHFQLRGVDDARYALSRLPAHAVPELALALEDDDPFVRLHVAQVLERMGPRARAALRALVARLDDPHTGVAAAAAEAIGAVGHARSTVERGPSHAESDTDLDSNALRTALVRRSEPGHGHDLRVAAVRGLGRLEDELALPTLAPLATDDSAPDDLRMAAVEGVIALGAGDDLVPYLAACLADPLADAGAAEALLGRWLDGAAASSPAHGAAASLWRALAPPFERVHTPEEVKARRRARGALVAPFVRH